MTIEDKRVIRYRINEPYKGRPRLVEDLWEPKTKIAMVTRERSSGYGHGWASREDIAEFERAAKTPEEAVEQWRERRVFTLNRARESYEDARRENDEAQAATIVDGKLVLP